MSERLLALDQQPSGLLIVIDLDAHRISNEAERDDRPAAVDEGLAVHHERLIVDERLRVADLDLDLAGAVDGAHRLSRAAEPVEPAARMLEDLPERGQLHARLDSGRYVERDQIPIECDVESAVRHDQRPARRKPCAYAQV